MQNNDLFVTSLRVKGQINESQQIFVQPKAFEPLVLRNDRPPCELVPNSFWGVAVNRLKVKRQSNKMIKILIKR